MILKTSKSKLKSLIRFNVVFLLSFLLYFCSNNITYAQNLQKCEPNYLVPIGNVLQIDAELKNIIVREISGKSPFNLGDAIVKVNNDEINGYMDFSQSISSLNNDDKVSVVVKRNGSLIEVNTTKDVLENMHFNNLLSGFATLTYIDPESKEFGAVGHAISLGSSKRIAIKSGSVSTTTDLDVEKSSKGSVGYINAKKDYQIGNFNINSDFGIKGEVTNFDLSNMKKYRVADLNEVERGKAKLIMQIAPQEYKEYDIEILHVENQKYPESKSFKIKIVDKELLSKTGGIVQGMSGTPIVQGDKIIGAVSHAVENDPSVGYGVYIGWMLNNK